MGEKPESPSILSSHLLTSHFPKTKTNNAGFAWESGPPFFGDRLSPLDQSVQVSIQSSYLPAKAQGRSSAAERPELCPVRLSIRWGPTGSVAYGP